VFYVCLFDVRLLEDDLKKIETCRSISELYFKVCINILVYKSQQDAQVTEFILADNCSTCFGRHYHPSSEAQNNCNYSIW